MVVTVKSPYYKSLLVQVPPFYEIVNAIPKMQRLLLDTCTLYMYVCMCVCVCVYYIVRAYVAGMVWYWVNCWYT